MADTLTDKVYNIIFSKILKGEYGLGEPISEAELGKELGVSRSPIREAIQRLEVEGIIVSYTSRGHFVVNLTLQDIDELFDIRELYETYALRKAFLRISVRHLEELEKEILDAQSINKSDEYFKANTDLHNTFIAYCGNVRLRKAFDMLTSQVRLVNRISAVEPTHFEEASKSHLAIIRAMKNGDCDEAERLLLAHLEEVRISTKKNFNPR